MHKQGETGSSGSSTTAACVNPRNVLFLGPSQIYSQPNLLFFLKWAQRRSFMCDNIFHILNICGVAFILTADKNTCSPLKQNEVNDKKKKKKIQI